MIANPVVYGDGKTYHIEADQFAQESGFPANGGAKAGEYVVSTSGYVVGSVRLLTADKKYTIESRKSKIVLNACHMALIVSHPF